MDVMRPTVTGSSMSTDSRLRPGPCLLGSCQCGFEDHSLYSSGKDLWGVPANLSRFSTDSQSALIRRC
jgi:hypothetical protein